ncbi:MAG: DoxX family protein [Bacteroidetes bacterium]|nr:DoxX family protein [Bacteroidota bacterium]
MKKIKIAYWIFTILLLALMLFSAIPNILVNKPSVDFMTGHLHYPQYLIPFLGWAKLLGVIAILIPGFNRVKEWAYAGFTFDLSGAVYSLISVGDPVSGWWPIVVGLLLIAASYILHHKKLNSQS